MAEIVISSGVVSSGINVGEETQLIVEAGGTVIDTVASSLDCGPIVVESGGLAVSTVIEDGAELRISGTANNTTATNLGSAILYDGGVANNTMVEDIGTLEIYDGGVANNTTVESDGTVYVYGGIASNTIVNEGELTVYGFADTAIIGFDGMIDVYGSAANITLDNGGELFIDDGGVVNGLTASGENSIYVDGGGKLTGRITLDSSPVTLTSDAVLDFDISAQAPGSAALLNDYSQVGAESGSVFTITVDANQTEGTYALAGGVTLFGGSLTVGTTDTEYGTVSLDDSLSYGGYTYTLTLGESTLDLTIAEGGGQPTSSGAVISDGTYPVSSGEFWLDTTINSGGTLTVSNGGRADSTTVNLNGWLNVYPEGTATAIVENGGWVNLDDGASATFASNTFSGITFESAQATIHSGTTAVDITLNEWGVMQVFDGGVVDSVTVNPGGGLTLRSGTALNIIENGGSVQTDLVPGASATMTFLPNTFSGAVVENGRFITAHSGTTAVDVTASGYGSMEVYSGGVLRGLTVGSAGRAVIQPGGKLTGSVTLDSNREQMILAQNAILDFDISAQSPNSTPLLNDYSLITIWGVASPTYTVTVDAAQAVGTYALAGGAAAFEGSISVGTDETVYGSVTVNGDALVYGDYTYTLTLTEGALDLTIAEGGGQVISGVVIPDEEHGIVSSGVTWLDTTIQYGAWFDVKAGGFASSTLIGGEMDVLAGGSADIATVNPQGDLCVSSGAVFTNITENGGAVTLEDGGSATFVPNTFSGVTVQFFATATVHSGTTAIDTTVGWGGNMEVFDGGVASNVTLTGAMFDANLNVHSGGKVTGSLFIDSSYAKVTMEEGSILDFDVSEQAPGSDPLVNDFALITGTPTYTITVDASQAAGAYALAGGADGFAATLTLGTADTAYGTITVNGDALVYGDYTFYLTLDSDALNLYVNEEPPAPPISGMVLIDSTFVVSPGVSVLDTQVSSGGVLEVLDYGLADSTSVNPNGSMCVYSGGTATEIVENGGYVGIYNGASATFVPTVLSGLIIENGGKTTLHSATEALDATVNSTGFLQVCDGGLVSGLAVTSGGIMDVYSGGKVTGSMTFSQATGALYLFSGGIVDFDISEEAPGSDPLLNDYSGLEVSEGAIFTITVDAAQANGAYALAGGADGFAVTLTLGTADTAYGTISLNAPLVYGDYTYTLGLTDSLLSLTVSSGEPPEPVIPRTELLGNGHSQILAWDRGEGKVGYRATDGEASPEWKGLWEWGEDADNWRVEGAGHFAGSTTDKDGVLLYDRTNQTLVAWTDITDPTYGRVTLCQMDGSFTVRGIGEFDDDGFDDVVVRNQSGSVGIISNGTDYHDVWHVADPADSVWQLIGMGRFSNNMDQDSLLFTNTENGHLYLWDNQGSDVGTWNWRQTDIGLLETGWGIAAIGDFAGDGIDDLVLVNGNDSEAAFIWDNGDQSTAHYVGILSTDSTRVEAVGDYDGDGKEDLLLREHASGWGGLGYWSAGTCAGWTDLNASIETTQENSFVIVA